MISTKKLVFGCRRPASKIKMGTLTFPSGGREMITLFKGYCTSCSGRKPKRACKASNSLYIGLILVLGILIVYR